MLLKVTVSGDYRTGGKNELVDFDGVVGIMPDVENDDFIMPAIQNRLLPIWIKNDKRYTQRFEMFRHVYIDSAERVEGELSIIGKDIKTMSWEELQDLAVYKNLRMIPAMRATDLRNAREIAYIEYSKNILGNVIDPAAEGYNFSELPALKVDASSKKASNPKQKTNEEVLSDEQQPERIEDQTFTMAELRQLAKEKGIKLPAGCDHAKAMKLVIG